ncbi:MAG: hypothetical protein J0M18_19910 [Ignavibacteria bacterium]|nr:hypothetical protein [Ignavibacteria bacterium]
MSEDLKIKAKDGNLIFQAETINFGNLSPEELSEWSTKLIEQNSYKITAGKTFLERITKWSLKFFRKLDNEYPDLKKSFENPDMQFNLIDTQKAIGRSSDENLGILLSDLLLERAKSEDKDFYKILLNESLRVVTLLTKSQLEILSLCFFLHNGHNYFKMTNLEEFKKYIVLLSKYFQTIDIHLKSSEFEHFEYTGCGKKTSKKLYLAKYYSRIYPGLFVHSLNKEQLINSIEENQYEKIKSIFIEKTENELVFKYIKAKDISYNLFLLGINNDTNDIFRSMFLKSKRVENECRNIILQIEPNFQDYFESWEASYLSSFELNNIGCILASVYINNNSENKINIKEFLEI